MSKPVHTSSSKPRHAGSHTRTHEHSDASSRNRMYSSSRAAGHERADNRSRSSARQYSSDSEHLESRRTSTRAVSNQPSALTFFLNRWSPLAIAVVVFALFAALLFGLSQCAGRDGTDPLAETPSPQSNTNVEQSGGDGATSTNADAASSSASTQTDYGISDNVEELLQYPEMIGGCEIVSLTSMLNAMGYDVSMHDIAENYIEYGSSYVYTYSGNPYSDGGGYPPVLTDAGNAYLLQQRSNFQFTDITGTSFSGLSYWLDKNVPVLVWTTMYLLEPMHTGYYEDSYEWYDNEHCLLVYGTTDSLVYVMDPLVGFTTYDRETFEAVYEECGEMAATLDI